MVKPSKGCSTCRTRKIKCDETRPACSQCLKAHYSCPGYQDRWTVMHRSQNEQFARRIRATNSIKHKRKYGSILWHYTEPQEDACTGHNSRPMAFPSSPVTIDEAVAFFLHNYVLKHGEIANAHLTHQQMINSTRSSEAVLLGMGAVGMASLANIRNSKGLRIMATREYTSTLHLTTVSLQDSTLCKSDETVIAVVLLGMFEFLINTTINIDRWEKHINGGMALLELRGVEQIHGKSGLQLFTQLRSNIMANCLRVGAEVPALIVEISKAAENLRPEGEKYADILVGIVSRLSTLRADIKSGRIADWLRILEMAMEIDRSFNKWASDAPARWHYVTLFHRVNDDATLKNSPLSVKYAYCGRYDIYPDLWATNVWNYYRATRMIVNWMILSLLAYTHTGPPNYSPAVINTLQQKAKENTIQLAEDICASVAFSFDPVGCRSIASGQKLPDSTYTAGGCLGGSLLIYPIAVAASISRSPSYLRTWMLSCLEYIAHDMGIGRAGSVLWLLEENKRKNIDG
ncbi:hypothetical protein BGW36DRAFT_297609 [Talaromyces proteolyticus]|uniref:Zn(2)-C6 fungal-type domain-containing protein n=1 Tax=Talaromyces proteolyticus TaxID=1131652 RepID=A0AAD4PZT7_9EURO|nr:uncharacterized protein BGW36DRAFT_297609 [Talaromyces proteolyticus]KAH8696321.1 hypothetical protein BGW36DRAFT_297609 [Talaromyces proteolyticus]